MRTDKEFEDFKRQINDRLWRLENPEKFKYGDRVKYYYSWMGGNMEFEGIYKGEANFCNCSRRCYVDTGFAVRICEEENLTKID